MSGYTYGDEQPTEKCPYCGSECDADFVDVGVGFIQCGPYHCLQCKASQMGPEDVPGTKDQERTGWFEPEHEPSPSANVIHGEIVSHRVMRKEYKAEFTANQLWHDKSYVNEWWEKIRK